MLPHRTNESAGAAIETDPAPSEIEIAPSQLDLLAEVSPSQNEASGDLKLAGEEEGAGGSTCPSCRAPFAAGAVVCVKCGMDMRSGRHVGTTAAPLTLAYAVPAARGTLSGKLASSGVEGPRRGFWADALLSFAYPFFTPGNGIAFALIAGIALLRIPLGFLARFSIYVWLSIGMIMGWPASLYLIAMLTGLVHEAMQSELSLALWIAGGTFFWPVFVMLFAFNALSMLIRLDLIFTTVFRTSLPYLSLWLMLLIVGFGSALEWAEPLLESSGISIPLPTMPDWGLGGEALMIVVDLYLSIVAMRLIGLYYLHFKKRFTLVFE